MEKPLPGYNLQPLDPQLLHEVTHQGLYDADGVDGGAPGYDLSIDEAIAVKECHQHQVTLASMDLGLY
jgi:hypothetical protein